MVFPPLLNAEEETCTQSCRCPINKERNHQLTQSAKSAIITYSIIPATQSRLCISKAQSFEEPWWFFQYPVDI
jgi:hypothetical protein